MNRIGNYFAIPNIEKSKHHHYTEVKCVDEDANRVVPLVAEFHVGHPYYLIEIIMHFLNHSFWIFNISSIFLETLIIFQMIHFAWYWTIKELIYKNVNEFFSKVEFERNLKELAENYCPVKNWLCIRYVGVCQSYNTVSVEYYLFGSHSKDCKQHTIDKHKAWSIDCKFFRPICFFLIIQIWEYDHKVDLIFKGESYLGHEWPNRCIISRISNRILVNNRLASIYNLVNYKENYYFQNDWNI